MKILDPILNKIKLSKPKNKFLKLLIMAMMGTVGRRTFRNMARYADMDEHTFARQMDKDIDFANINLEIIREAKKPDDVVIIAQDSTFIQKAGKKTFGVDYYWNGTAGRVEKGLELDLISAIVMQEEGKHAFALSGRQFAEPKTDQKVEKKDHKNKINFFLDNIKSVLSQIQKLGAKHVVADGFLYKRSYVDGVVDMMLHVVSKLRSDAQLLLLYDGPQKTLGRRRAFVKDKVTEEHFLQAPAIRVDDKKELRSLVCYSPCLKRKILVVAIFCEGRLGAMLFTTDLTLSPQQVYKFYSARYQIEFIFRDAKGFAGLEDCQARSQKRLDYHFNASFLSFNFAKLQDLIEQQKHKTSQPFSMASISRKISVEICVNRIFSMLGFDLTSIKSNPCYNDALNIGGINRD